MFERILIPLDGSVLAEQALTPAIKIAAHTGAELLLLRSVSKTNSHVLDPAAYHNFRPAMTYEDRRDQAQEYLYGIVNARKQPEFAMDVIIEIGDPATAIVDTALHEPADLIVMTTHGASGLDRWMFGSVTEKVLRHAPCPVLALRSADLPKSFLVTLDGSELAETVIDPAVTIAQAFDASITLMRVETPKEAPDWVELKALETMDRELAQHVNVQYEKTVGDYLEKLRVGRLADVGVSVTYDIDRGKPAERILEAATRDECDLIAMSTHGRTGLRRWRYGSVTEKVLRKAKRPMLITRPDAEVLNA